MRGISDGQVSCSLFGQKADIPVRLTHLGNNVYKAVYTPLIPGVYELQVQFYQIWLTFFDCRCEVV